MKVAMKEVVEEMLMWFVATGIFAICLTYLFRWLLSFGVEEVSDEHTTNLWFGLFLVIWLFVFGSNAKRVIGQQLRDQMLEELKDASYAELHRVLVDAKVVEHVGLSGAGTEFSEHCFNPEALDWFSSRAIRSAVESWVHHDPSGFQQRCVAVAEAIYAKKRFDSIWQREFFDTNSPFSSWRHKDVRDKLQEVYSEVCRRESDKKADAAKLRQAQKESRRRHQVIKRGLRACGVKYSEKS